MQCNKCGNELHIDAEACWRCGSHTESALVRKQERQRARQVEEEKRARARQVEEKLAELRQREDSEQQALAPNRVFRTPWSSALAPSEVVLLNGEQASQTGLVRFDQRTTFLQLKTGVFRGELLLLVAAIKVALLAIERNGEIKLKVEKYDGFLGPANSLTIEPWSAPGEWQWPQGSLEEQIGSAHERVSGILDFTGTSVIGLIYRISRNSVGWTSWRTLVVNEYTKQHLFRGIVDPLVERGLAEPIPGDGMLFGVIPYRSARVQLSEAGQKAVTDYDLEEVRQLLLRCKQKRPDIWSCLDKEIVWGLQSALSTDGS